MAFIEGNPFYDELPKRVDPTGSEIPIGHHALEGSGVIESDFEQGKPSSGHIAFRANEIDEADRLRMAPQQRAEDGEGEFEGSI